jgi:N-ethylmaleimide reductase
MTRLLFSESHFGRITLKNRIVMGPMTRNRALGNVANETMALYYSQRADAGLIITEGTSPSPNGLGYPRIPGIYNAAQVDGWKKVTEAVHRLGGRIFLQLMHTGRASHRANLPPGSRVLAPSPIALCGTMFTDAHGPQPYPVPEEMSQADIMRAIEEYVSASRMAIVAGFDGVELHGANGYLIDQFLNTATNHRTDQWGSGSVASRIRFSLETAREVGKAIGFDRLGIRLSPYGTFNDMKADRDTDCIYEQLAGELGKMRLLYIHLADQSSTGTSEAKPSVKQKIRDQFGGYMILSGGYDAIRAEIDLAKKKGDLIAFARPFISNPNLVAKLKDGIALTPPDPATFYSPGKEGYTDY